MSGAAKELATLGIIGSIDRQRFEQIYTRLITVLAKHAGPWQLGEDVFINGYLGISDGHDNCVIETVDSEACSYNTENDENIYEGRVLGEFIVNAPRDIRDLLATIRNLETKVLMLEGRAAHQQEAAAMDALDNADDNTAREKDDVHRLTEALQEVLEALKPLPHGARARILRSAAIFYGVSLDDGR